MVDRTKPSKLRVFGESDLLDCQQYFSQIQSDSTLPANEIITATERLILIRSEIDLRHADTRYRRTQRLASLAIGVGMLSLSVAGISGVAQYLANKPVRDNQPATKDTLPVAASTPMELPIVTPTVTATTTDTPDLTAAPIMPVVATPSPRATPTEQRRKKRRARPEMKKKAQPDPSIERILRSLVRPKATPRAGHR